MGFRVVAEFLAAGGTRSGDCPDVFPARSRRELRAIDDLAAPGAFVGDESSGNLRIDEMAGRPPQPFGGVDESLAIDKVDGPAEPTWAK